VPTTTLAAEPALSVFCCRHFIEAGDGAEIASITAPKRGGVRRDDLVVRRMVGRQMIRMRLEQRAVGEGRGFRRGRDAYRIDPRGGPADATRTSFWCLPVSSVPPNSDADRTSTAIATSTVPAAAEYPSP
jgi:hypothetical protein